MLVKNLTKTLEGAEKKQQGFLAKTANGAAKLFTGLMEAADTYNTKISHVVNGLAKQYTAAFQSIQEEYGGARNPLQGATQSIESYIQSYSDAIDQFKYTTTKSLKIGTLDIQAWAGEGEQGFRVAMGTFKDILGRNVADSTKMMRDMNSEQMIQLSMYSKGLGLTSSEIGTFTSRELSRSGKSSNKMLSEFAASVKAVSKATGESSKVIAKIGAKMASDLDKYGNMSTQSMARLSASIQQVGIAYEDMDGIVGKFQGFESAATAVGNLTAVFGVQMDAMEMFKLANTDQEAFFHRMRDSLISQGIAYEDLNLQQKKVLKEQTGITSQEAMQRFLDPSVVVDSMDELMAATEDVDMTQGLDAIKDDIALLPNAVENAAKRAKQRFHESFTVGMGRELVFFQKKMMTVQKTVIQTGAAAGQGVANTVKPFVDELKKVDWSDMKKMMESVADTTVNFQDTLATGDFAGAVSGIFKSSDKGIKNMEKGFGDGKKTGTIAKGMETTWTRSTAGANAMFDQIGLRMKPLEGKSESEASKKISAGFKATFAVIEKDFGKTLDEMSTMTDKQMGEALIDPQSDLNKLYKNFSKQLDENNIKYAQLKKLSDAELETYKEKYGWGKAQLDQMIKMKGLSEKALKKEEEASNIYRLMNKYKKEGYSWSQLSDDSISEWSKKLGKSKTQMKDMWAAAKAGQEGAFDVTKAGDLAKLRSDILTGKIDEKGKAIPVAETAASPDTKTTDKINKSQADIKDPKDEVIYKLLESNKSRAQENKELKAMLGKMGNQNFIIKIDGKTWAQSILDGEYSGGQKVLVESYANK